jgi:alkanesulfonate monooxygenase SsuD/methylene tetrahydromethanopterin reductase-like flavin-dependent oxidoreductase (luciferase family)
MRVGITLPQFEDQADQAIEAARRAESLGIDGVFCFDHLWPIGQPGRPALSSGPLLGALAASTSTITLGSLVSRVGLVPDEVLVSVLSTLAAISGGRFIAGLGTGDRLSRAENEAYGLPFGSADDRRASVEKVAAATGRWGIPVWIGGGQRKTVDLARSVGASVNLWAATPQQVAELTASGLDVTWGGPVGATVAEATARLVELAGAGASWAVCGWPNSLEVVAEAAWTVRGPG